MSFKNHNQNPLFTIKTNKMKNTKEILMYSLAALIVIGFFTLLVVFVLREIPEGNQRVLDMTLGALIAAFSMVVSYFFGSSKGSSDKNELFGERQKLENRS